MTPPKPKTYTLRLTERQLWFLMDSYEASFTEPESMNKIEVSVQKKLQRLYLKAHADKKKGN